MRHCQLFFPGRLLILCLLFSGCAHQPLHDVVVGADYVPRNIYKESETLPPTVRKVVVLPLNYTDAGTLGIAGRETLEPILQAELTKQNKIELVFLKPQQLQQWTGKDHWDFQEALPPDFLKILREKTDADALLFSSLTHYSPYPPLKIGWRFKLATTTDADILWSADEIFDAGESAVSNSARRYAKGHLNKTPVLEDSHSILLSPSSFGQYTLRSLFDTIPAR